MQSISDCIELQASLTADIVPDWLVGILSQYKLCGTELELSREYDASGLGASVGFLNIDGILSEARDCQPGKSVVPLGFLPFGADLTGSGDPYFLDLRRGSDDPEVVRVPHDLATELCYPVDKIERVCPLSALIRNAQN